MYKLPAGTYYIGDLCYVIDNENWSDFCDLLDKGEFEYNDKKVASLYTAFGDGLYKDQFGNSYPVDAGIIGVLPIELVEIEADKIQEYGAVFTFEKDFNVFEEDETLYFGHIEIPTGTNDEDDEEYEDDHDYDDYGSRDEDFKD